MMKPVGRVVRGLLLAIALLVFAGAPFLSPVGADLSTARAAVLSEDDEPPSSIGNDFDLGLRITMEAHREVGFVDEDSLVQVVNDIGYRVASVAPRTDRFTFHIIDLPYPNAFALPGGFIFITKGMLELGLTEPELAALLGHEIGHVVGGHFGRSQRLSSVLSLAQVALLVGVMLLGDESGSSTRYEQQGDVIYGGSTGKEALVQGVPAFGGLFRTLIERKYGRSLEFEADETGARLAALAGYPPDGAEQLLRRFREHIHEETTYGYWLTHPFFKERIPKTAALARALEPSPEPPPAYAYRRALQRELFRVASRRRNEGEAAFLYQLALRAEPHGMTALEAGRKILQFRAGRQAKKRPLERDIFPIVADYDSLITRAERLDPGGISAANLAADRDSLERSRTDLLPRYLEELDRDVRSTSLLESFVRNYPDQERLPEMQAHLAENYRESGRPNQAARTCLDLLADHPQAAWSEKVTETLVQIVDRVENPIVVQELVNAELPDSLHAMAAARMDSLSTSVDSLEEAASYLERYPDTPYAPAMRARLDEKAEEAYQEARILEGLARQQEALDAYHHILFTAPESSAAQMARDRIDQLVRTG